MEKQLPRRKSTRLIGFDYSSARAYFVTICTQNREQILSEIVKVGEGLAPPAYSTILTPCGKIAEEQIHLLEERYPDISVMDYVIMPDHIHMIVLIGPAEGGASPSPTLNGVVCAFKSLTSRACKRQMGVEKIFQRSFFDHIIRDMKDYETRKKYIYENPMRWYEGW